MFEQNVAFSLVVFLFICGNFTLIFTVFISREALAEAIIGLFWVFFISSTRFLLQQYDVTKTSNLLFVHSVIQFQLKCVRDVIFHSYWSECFCSFA